MGFVIGVVAALLVVFLLAYITLKKPVFGRVLIAISLAFILLSIFLYFQKDTRTERRQNLIAVEKIDFTEMKYAYAYGNNYKLMGKVTNHSTRYRLQSITLKLSFYDCQDAQVSINDCQLIDDMTHTIKTRLAPEKSVDVESYLLLKKENYITLRWQAEVISGVAR